MRCEECLPLIEEYLDGELNGRIIGRLEAHLSICAECAIELAELNREQEIYALYQRDLEVTPAQWNIVSARIEQEKDALALEPRKRLLGWLGGLVGSGRREARPAFVSALLLVLVGIVATVIYLNSHQSQSDLASQTGRQQEAQTLPSPDKAPTPGSINETNTGVVRQQNHISDSPKEVTAQSAANPTPRKNAPALASFPRPQNRRIKQPPADESVRFEVAMTDPDNVITGIRQSEPEGDLGFEIVRHAERAQLLLRSFRNVRLPASNRAMDVSYEKTQSRKLLYQNIALRYDAAARGDQATAELLNTLEPILLDIAHLPDRAKPRDVRSIEQRIEKKEIVTALQVHTLIASN